MMQDKIIFHEDIYSVSYTGFLSEYYRVGKGGELPAVGPELERVYAYINHGRWVAECPLGCGDAKVLSGLANLYICTEPGCPSMDWYQVVFPEEREEIEAVLLSRRAHRPDMALARNWKPGESLSALEAENVASLPRSVMLE